VGAVQAIEYVAAKGMALRQLRVIEVVGRIAGHADLFHYAAGSNVRGGGEGNEGLQRQRFKRVAHHCLGCFRRESASPILRGQPPPNFHARRKMRLEGRYRKPRKSNECALRTQLERIQPRSMLTEMILNAIGQEIAFSGREPRGHELHHPSVGIEARKRLAVAWLPISQQQALCFDCHASVFAFLFPAEDSHKQGDGRGAPCAANGTAELFAGYKDFLPGSPQSARLVSAA
jgi:hypothetical protein